MIATGHQPAYLPWLGLLHKIAVSDLFISWDAVPMESSGFENRNRIPGPAGGLWLTVPVQRGRNIPIKDIAIATEHDWQRKHFRSIEQVYAKAPFWARYKPTFEYLYLQQRWTRLVDLSDQVLTFLLHEFDVHLKRVKLSDLALTSTNAQLVLDACKKVGAWKYVFGAKGPDYANGRLFREQSIEPLVQEYLARPYHQLGGGPFVPNLWAFDVLLNVGPDEGREVMLAGGTVRRME